MTALPNTGAAAWRLGDSSFRLHLNGNPLEGDRRAERQAAGRVMRTAARSAISWSGRIWGAVDVLIGSAAFAAAHLLSPHAGPESHLTYNLPLAATTFSLFLLFFNYVLGGYDRHAFTSVGRLIGRVLAVNAAAMAATSLTFGWLGFVQIGRYVVLGTFVLSAVGTFACRMAARELARRAKIRVLFVGARRKFRPHDAQIRSRHAAFYERPVYLETGTDAVADRRARLIGAFAEHRPDEIVVMDNDPVVSDVLHHSAGILRAGCGIFAHRTYYEDLLGEVPVECVDERGVLDKGFNIGSLHTGLAKRLMDIGLALVGVLLGAPLMLLCALLVKATSPGPIIYKQTRVGRYGRLFSIYKFRTMRTDAERGGAVWARANDTRVTPVGTLLRRTRFDELPQLWNILRGDMSLVGPRPERPEFVQQLPHYELRHHVLPGLTGWAQVRFRYGATVADAQRKLAYDLYFVRNCGLVFDAAICLRTLVALAKGAR